MSVFQAFCYAFCAIVAVSPGCCEQEVATDKPEQQANRRSIGAGEYYAPAYHGHYAPLYHGHYAPVAAVYPHGNHLHYAPAAATYHGHHHHYAPFHGHDYHYDHHHAHHRAQPVSTVYHQSVVHTYPTTTAVVHRPVAVPVAHPVPVPVARPVAVEVPRPYPVPVNRPYPVAVLKPVAVPVAQPYPVPVYKPYPVYRAVAVRPVAQYARVPVRAPVVLRYPAQPLPSSAIAYPYAPHHLHHHQHVAAPLPAYAQQPLVRTPLASAEYDVNEATAQAEDTDYRHLLQQQQQEQLLQQQQDSAAFQGHQLLHHDDSHHNHHHHLHHGDHLLDQASGVAGGYQSLTAADDEPFKTSLAVPNVDYTGKKK